MFLPATQLLVNTAKGLMKEEVLLCYNNSSLFCQEAQWAGRVVVAVLCSTRCIVALRRLELERGEGGQTCGKTTGCHLSPCLNPGIPLYFIPGCCTLYKCGYNLSPWLPPGSCTSTRHILLYIRVGFIWALELGVQALYVHWLLYFIHQLGVTWAFTFPGVWRTNYTLYTGLA